MCILEKISALKYRGVNNNFLDQNVVKPLRVGYRNTLFNGYICILIGRSRIDMGDVVEYKKQGQYLYYP